MGRALEVAVTLVEARLTGPNINPIVCIQVGDQRKYSSEKTATHCPYFNEALSSKLASPIPTAFLAVLCIRLPHARVQFHGPAHRAHRLPVPVQL